MYQDALCWDVFEKKRAVLFICDSAYYGMPHKTKSTAAANSETKFTKRQR